MLEIGCNVARRCVFDKLVHTAESASIPESLLQTWAPNICSSNDRALNEELCTRRYDVRKRAL